MSNSSITFPLLLLLAVVMVLTDGWDLDKSRTARVASKDDDEDPWSFVGVCC